MRTFIDLLTYYMPALIAALILGALAYLIVAALLKRRGRSLSRGWKVWLFVSASYLFAILFLLVLRSSRGGSYYGGPNFELFYGYRQLTRSFTSHAFLNELMNILIFVPFGFFFALPFGESRKRWLVIPLGALTSLLVEVLQYLFGLGIADVDDLFNNTLGTVCGFALARCCMGFRAKKPGRGALALVLTLLCLTPPFAAWAVYGATPYGEGAYDVYYGQPVTGEVSFSDEAAGFISGLTAQDLPVYTAESGTLDDAREYAAAFFARFGTEIDSEDLYDESAWFRDSSQQRMCIYHYAGREIELEDYTVRQSGHELKPGLTEDELRACALEWGVEIPEGAELSADEYSYIFTLKPTDGKGGEVSVAVTEDGLARIRYAIYSLSAIGSAQPLSAAECETILHRGDYSCWDTLPEGEVHIERAEVIYSLDSKGTYRPILTLHGGGCEIHIPLGMA